MRITPAQVISFESKNKQPKCKTGIDFLLWIPFCFLVQNNARYFRLLSKKIERQGSLGFKPQITHSSKKDSFGEIDEMGYIVQRYIRSVVSIHLNFLVKWSEIQTNLSEVKWSEFKRYV